MPLHKINISWHKINKSWHKINKQGFTVMQKRFALNSMNLVKKKRSWKFLANKLFSLKKLGSKKF